MDMLTIIIILLFNIRISHKYVSVLSCANSWFFLDHKNYRNCILPPCGLGQFWFWNVAILWFIRPK